MAKISVLGLGAMGSRMAANLIKSGHQVTVWNRSPQATRALTDAGAQVSRTPREKDFGYMLQAAESDSAAPTIAAARGVFRAVIERGFGEENMTGVVKLFT